MHIVHVAGALKGGPLAVVAELSRRQIGGGHEVSLVYSPMRDPPESFCSYLPPEVMLCPLEIRREIHPASDLRATFRLVRRFRTMRPDIVHLHSSKAGAIGRIAARLAGTPAVYSPHGISYLRTDVTWATRAVYFALEWILGLAGTVTAASSPSELEALRAMPGRKVMIPNAINLGALQPKNYDEPPSQELQIILYSRITAQKDPTFACKIAEMSPPSWRWFWLGDGELSDVVRRSGRIEILGWMPHAAALARLRSADILVHTSKWEGMPMGILECMALGLPVVATGAIGNRDLVMSGETGFIANAAPAFLAALGKLANSRELRRGLGEAGRRRVIREFNPVLLATRWLDLYTQLQARTKSLHHVVAPPPRRSDFHSKL